MKLSKETCNWNWIQHQSRQITITQHPLPIKNDKNNYSLSQQTMALAMSINIQKPKTLKPRTVKASRRTTLKTKTTVGTRTRCHWFDSAATVPENLFRSQLPQIRIGFHRSPTTTTSPADDSAPTRQCLPGGEEVRTIRLSSSSSSNNNNLPIRHATASRETIPQPRATEFSDRSLFTFSAEKRARKSNTLPPYPGNLRFRRFQNRETFTLLLLREIEEPIPSITFLTPLHRQFHLRHFQTLPTSIVNTDHQKTSRITDAMSLKRRPNDSVFLELSLRGRQTSGSVTQH